MSNTQKTTRPTGPLDLDVLLAETEAQPFTFTLGGKERSLPHAKTLDTRQVRMAERGDWEVLLPQITDDEDLVAAIIDLPMFAMEPLVERWLKHSGTNLGESQASSSS